MKSKPFAVAAPATSDVRCCSGHKPGLCTQTFAQSRLAFSRQAKTLQLAPLGQATLVDEEGFGDGGGRVALVGQGHRQDVKLLRQWLAANLRPYDYMTVELQGEDGGRQSFAFQLLDLERKSIIVRPFISTDDEAEMSGLYTVMLQPLEVWGGRAGATRQMGATTMDVFVLQDPCKADIVGACGTTMQSRSSITVWQTRNSDVDGCCELYGPERILDRPVDLMGAQVPVLSLLDALGGKGFKAVEETVEHKMGVLAYDCRRVTGRRSYLQCVLHMGRLAAKGVHSFRSNGTMAFFSALLHCKSPVRPGLSAQAYKRLLAAEQGDEDALAALADADDEQLVRLALPAAPAGKAGARPHRSLTRRGQQQQAQPDDGTDSDDSSIVGPEAHAPPPAVATDGAGAGSSDDSSVIGAPAGEPEGALVPAAPAEAQPRPIPVGVPSSILGVKVSFVPGRQTVTHTYADRLSVRCSNPAHARCMKSRSTELLRARLGARCAESFLGAWLAKAYTMGDREHGKYMPTVADMQHYLAEHPEA